MRIQRTKRHMVCDIHGAIQACFNKDRTVLKLLDEKNFDTCIKHLREMLQAGYQVVPSENCDNQDYEGRCLGHARWVEEDKEPTVATAAEGMQRLASAMAYKGEYLR